MAFLDFSDAATGSEEVYSWKKEGISFQIAKVDLKISSHYCGYCTFPNRPVREEGYYGIIGYVPVHGGVTYAEPESDGRMTYGFDCTHVGDDTNPSCRDRAWIAAECERMAKAIELAAKLESKFLRARSDKGRNEVIRGYHKECENLGLVYTQPNYLADTMNVLLEMC